MDWTLGGHRKPPLESGLPTCCLGPGCYGSAGGGAGGGEGGFVSSPAGQDLPTHNEAKESLPGSITHLETCLGNQ